MFNSEGSTNIFISAYSLARRTGLLKTSLGRHLFKFAYFNYKRYLEDDLRGLLRRYPGIANGGNALDVGANIGYTAAVLARSIAPEYRVFAFEPEPFNFDLLQQTARRREFAGKIVPMQAAVGAEQSTCELWLNEHHHADHRVVTEKFGAENPGAKKIVVPQVSIDSFFNGRPMPISVIKIDVQGFELAVCNGMPGTLEANPNASVILEYMPQAMREMGFEPRELLEFFVERNFTLYRIGPKGTLSAGIPTQDLGGGYINLLCSRQNFAA